LKNAICVQAGLYDDLETSLDTAAQKKVTEELNAATCRALEGGYMSTQGMTYVRNSSFYLTDAIAVDSFINELRFHNNLYLASTHAKANNLSIKDTGLMLYQYEYDKSLKVYSITIDLEQVGKDENFHAEASKEEKAERVISILDAIANLSLTVKGNLDNAEPLFVIGGLSRCKTHFFENVVKVKRNSLVLEEGVKEKLCSDQGDFKVGVLKCGQLDNEDDIVRELQAVSTEAFFKALKDDVAAYFS
jgi:CRISPR-associated protein Cst2